MSPLQSRLTLMVDEWLGIALVVWLWFQAGWPVDVLLWIVIPAFVTFVYGVGYLCHFKLEARHREREDRRG